MSLEEKLKGYIEKTAASVSRNKKKIRDYLIKYELKDYFENQDLDEQERERLISGLERHIESSFEKYSGELNGLLRKSGSKGTMFLDIANQLYGYVSKVPVGYIGGLHTSLFALKSLIEIPALYRYAKKSKDWYGISAYLLTKPLRWLLPVIGPALESGAFERMVTKGIIKEAKYKFIKEFGNYVSLKEKISERLSTPVGEAIYLPAAA